MSTFRERLRLLIAGASPSFRSKLLVAMMLVVSAITATAIYCTQRAMEAGAKRSFQQEFQAAFANLLGVQAAHRAMIAERCTAIASALRTRSALEEMNLEALYLNADIELRALLRKDQPATDASALQATFFCFLDARGAVLPPPKEYGGALPALLDAQLAVAAGASDQQVGYVAVDLGDGRQRVDEIISTPITATDTGEIIGMLVLGFRPAGFDAQFSGANGRSAIRLRDQLYSPSLDDATLRELEVAIHGSHAPVADRLADPLPISLAGRAPYLIFTQWLNPQSKFPPAELICLYSLADAVAEQQHLRWEILGAGSLLLCAGLGASHLLAAKLSVPVEKLAVVSAEQRAGRERAEAELEAANEVLVARNAELQVALATLKTTQQHVIQQERLRALGQMASGIAHDFNNALVPILGFCELLQIRPDILADRVKAMSYLETIQTAAKDAASVVSRLREFYRADKGEKPFAPVNLKRLLEQTITLTRPKWKEQAQAAGVHIDVSLDLQPVPPIAGEESALREVLTNLVFNAVDAMPVGGRLTLRTRREGNSAVMEVSDSGTGMTEEVRKRCLEPFFSTKGEHGTGLGLSMVFGIVQRHSGSLDILSEPGVGTSFVIKLPLMDAIVGHADDAPLGKPARGLRILVVDDEAPVRDTLAAVLAADGHEVTLAIDGSDGLRKFGAGRFDVVITDKAMPRMNGDQMAATIKTIAPETRIILLTGFGLFYDKKDFPDIDVLASKPVRITALREAIATATSLS
jgi:signal transduction histidine kinase